MCDPKPTYISSFGFPTQNMDVIKINTSKKDSKISLTKPNTDNVILDVIAIDATGNISTKNIGERQ